MHVCVYVCMYSLPLNFIMCPLSFTICYQPARQLKTPTLLIWAQMSSSRLLTAPLLPHHHNLSLFLGILFFVCLFWDKVSQFIPGCPRTLYVDQTGPECRDTPACASQVLGLKVRGATPTLYSSLHTVSMFVFPNAIVDKWRCGTQQTIKWTLNCDFFNSQSQKKNFKKQTRRNFGSRDGAQRQNSI